MMMNSGCISWKTKLQTVVAHSTTDAEVYAATLAIKEVIYLRDALRRIGLPQATESDPRKGTTLYEDNEATTTIARTAAHREATKHMAIARSFLRYHHENGTISIQDCYTNMQVADFLTKSLGKQIFHKLVDEAMGKQQMCDTVRFSRKNWKEKYEEAMKAKAKEAESDNLNETTTDDDMTPGDAQGGMLKSVFIDTVYMNVMQLESEFEGPDYMLCDSIEDYMKYEQHRSCIINRVQEEDLSIENRYYKNVTMLYRMNIVN
jgi:hypothetical protein